MSRIVNRNPVGPRRTTRSSSTPATVVAIAGGLVATAAPASFTGRPTVDLIERFLLTAAFGWVVAHGRRSTLLVCSAPLLLVARGPALLFLLVSLTASVINLTRPHRVKAIGAVAAVTAVNAVLHLPPVGLHPLHPLWIGLFGLVAFIAASRHLRRRHRRIVRRASFAFGLILVVATLLTGVAVIRSIGPVRDGATQARRALESVRDGDTATAARNIEGARDDLADGDRFLGTIGAPGALVPGLSQQLGAFETAVNEARSLTDVADDLLTIDYDDLRYDGGLALDLVADLIPGTERVEAALARAETNLGEVRAGPLLPGLRGPVEEFHDTVVRAHTDARRANRILPELPGLLGGRGPRRYLLVFITPAELRGAGGFIGSWAELRLENGRAEMDRSGRIRDLIAYGDATGRVLGGPDDYRRRYGRFGVENLVQDAPMSPHWPSNAEALASIYPQAGGSEVDGVVAIDPAGLAALLRLTGPVEVAGLDEPLTADDAEDLLLRRQYLELGDRAAREDVLADATEAVFDRLVTTSLPSPRTLGDVLGPTVRGRHLQVWFRERSEQTLMAELEADGALDIPPGADGWRVAQQNVGNNKIDAYLQRDVDYEITLDPRSGRYEGRLTLTLRNAPPSLDLPTVVVGNERGVPVGTNLATVALHAPFRTTAARLDGEPLSLGLGDEVGLPVRDTPILRLGPTEPTVIEFDIEGIVDLRDGYRLRVLPQPLAEPDRLTVRVHLDAGSFGEIERLAGTAAPEVVGPELSFEGVLDEVVDLRVAVRP